MFTVLVLISPAHADRVLAGSLADVVAAAQPLGVSLQLVPSPDPAANRRAARWDFDLRFADELPAWFVVSMVGLAATTAGTCVVTPSHPPEGDCLPRLWMDLDGKDVPEAEATAMFRATLGGSFRASAGPAGVVDDLDATGTFDGRRLKLDYHRHGHRFRLVATLEQP